MALREPIKAAEKKRVAILRERAKANSLRPQRPPPGYYEQKRIEFDVKPFRNSIYYGPEKEERTCIWDGGELSWSEYSFGIPWIAVSGTDFTCVVPMNGKTSIRPSCRRPLSIRDVLKTVLADTGVLADTTTDSTKFRRDMRDLGYKEGPFAVVSVAPDAAVSRKCREDAICFLKQSLKDRKNITPQNTLTPEKTKKIAVCALQCLLGSEFKSDKIEGWGTGGLHGVHEILNASIVDSFLASCYVPKCHLDEVNVGCV